MGTPWLTDHEAGRPDHCRIASRPHPEGGHVRRPGLNREVGDANKPLQADWASVSTVVYERPHSPPPPAATMNIRDLLRLLVVQVSASTACAWGLSSEFQQGKRVVILNALLAVGLCFVVCGATALLLGLARRWRIGLLARLAVVLPSVVFGSTLLLYLGHFASQDSWGRNLTAGVAVEGAALLWKEGTGSLPVDVTPWILAVAAIAALTLAHARLFVTSPVAGAHGVSRRTSAAAVMSGLVVWIVILGGIAAVRDDPRHYKLLRYEAFSSFLVWPMLKAAARTRSPETARVAAAVRGGARPMDVILVILDAARPDRMSAYGHTRATTPNLDRMLAEGRLRKVEMALATCPETLCSVSSLMTSRFLEAEPGPRLPEILADNGYRLYFLLSGDHSWYGLRDGYELVPDLIFDGNDAVGTSASDDEALFQGLAEVPPPSDEPAFFYIHLLSTHEMGFQHEAFDRWRPSDHRWRERLVSPSQRDAGYNHYDNGMLQADDTLARLLRAIEEKGYRRDRVVFVVGDHGQGFWEHGPEPEDLGHIFRLHAEQMRIPMLIEDDPSVEYRNLRFATLLDVAPTIAQRLGIPAPTSWEGRSLLAQPDERWTFHRTATSESTWAVVHDSRDARHKYIRHPDGREELYDLQRDPTEHDNLAAAGGHPQLADLRRQLETKLASCANCREW